MANLATLPTELLQLIATITVWHELYGFRSRIFERGDLVNLSYVNRRLNAVINEVIYRDEKKRGFSVLLNAVETGRVETVKLIRDLGFDMHYFDRSGSPGELLRRACKNRQHEMVQWLLDNGFKFEDLVKCEPFGDTMALGRTSMLAEAIELRNEEAVFQLLSRNASPYFVEESTDPDSPPERPWTALHLAAGAGMTGLVKHFVREMGIPINHLNSMGLTPLGSYFYEMEYYGRIRESYDDIRCINDVDIEERWDYQEDTTLLQQLILLGADVNVQCQCRLPVEIALMTLHYDHVDMLLDAGAKVDLEGTEEWGKFDYLEYCIPYEPESCYPEDFPDKKHAILKRLIEAGIDPNLGTAWYGTPLELAVLRGLPETVSVLVELGASLGPTTPEGDNILDFFLRNFQRLPDDFFGTAEALVKCGAKIDIPLVSTGESFLMGLCRLCGNETDLSLARFDDLLGTAIPLMSNPDLIHDVLEDLLNTGKVRRTMRMIICNILIYHGAAVRKGSIAATAISEFIGPHDAPEDGWLPESSEDDLFNSLLDMTPRRCLNGLYEQANSLDDEISAFKIYNRIASGQNSKLQKKRDSIEELCGELASTSIG
ncbi:ankyrin repeat-containing domain protein [Annulohypoxylon moriforme]|nr:ankyrin repeat-containing domain protein [Annulohypoxylon moriforme]